ncbi:unnamed protein product [Boreogadus saida]
MKGTASPGPDEPSPRMVDLAPAWGPGDPDPRARPRDRPDWTPRTTRVSRRAGGLGQTLFHASAPLSQRGPLALTSGHSYDPMQMVSVISAQTISSQEPRNSPSQLMSHNALLCCSEKRVLSQRFPSFHSLFLARVGRPVGMSRPPEVLQKNRGLLSPGPAEPMVGTTAHGRDHSAVRTPCCSRSPPARLRFSSCSPHVLHMFSSCSPHALGL